MTDWRPHADMCPAGGPGAGNATGVKSEGNVTAADGSVSEWSYSGRPDCPGVGGTFTATMSEDCLTITTRGVTQYGTGFEGTWTRVSPGPAGCGDPPETIRIAPGGRWGGGACGASATIAQACKPVSLDPGQSATTASPPIAPRQTEAVVHVSGDVIAVVEAIRKRRNERIRGCVGMYVTYVDNDVENWEGKGADFMLACLRAVFELEQEELAAARPPARAAATTCPLASFDGRAGSVVRRGDGTPNLAVTCSRTAQGARIRVRARTGTLRSLVGPRLEVGVYRSQAASGAARAGIRFTRP